MTDKTSSIDILEGAKRLLLDKGWCQGEWAYAEGGPVFATHATACQFCAEGALMRAAFDLGLAHPLDTSDKRNPAYVSAEHTLIQGIEDTTGALYGRDIARFNDEDGRTVEEVVAAYDRALVCLRDEVYLKNQPEGDKL